MSKHLVKFGKPVKDRHGDLVYTSLKSDDGTHAFEHGAFTITKSMVNEGGRNGCFTTPEYHAVGPAMWAATSRLDERCPTLIDARTHVNWVIDPNWDSLA